MLLYMSCLLCHAVLSPLPMHGGFSSAAFFPPLLPQKSRRNDRIKMGAALLPNNSGCQSTQTPLHFQRFETLPPRSLFLYVFLLYQPLIPCICPSVSSAKSISHLVPSENNTSSVHSDFPFLFLIITAAAVIIG